MIGEELFIKSQLSEKKPPLRFHTSLIQWRRINTRYHQRPCPKNCGQYNVVGLQSYRNQQSTEQYKIRLNNL